jgi:signal transduction histidine kinase
MQLERVSGANARTHVFSPAGWAPLRLRSSIKLPDGTFLNAVQYPAGAYEWGRVLAYSLPVTTLPVLLIVMFFIARVVRPVKTLAQATERVSRGEWIAPLPETGPQEARDLTAAFNTMQANLARHVEGRTRMLAAVSHDLNTPITELRLQVELLEPGEGRDDMLESLAELSAMVRETLNFVRDDAVQEPTTALPLSGLLDDLAKRYQRLQQPVTWHGAPPLMLTCRPLALKRALTNLIDNALHHGGDAQLSLTQQSNGWLCVEILDHGQGLPEDWLAKVFEPFVQRGVNDGGVGLGLAIARSCIQAHGGELVLENRPPAGLCAVVRLPAAL